MRMEEKILGAFEGKSTEERLANVPRIPQRETWQTCACIFVSCVSVYIYIVIYILGIVRERERGN